MKVTTQTVIDHLNKYNADPTDPDFRFAERAGRGRVKTAPGDILEVKKGEIYRLASMYPDGSTNWNEDANLRRQIESR